MIRFVTPEVAQLPQLAALYADVFNAPPWNDHWTAGSAGRRIHQMICVEDFVGVCAMEDDRPVGLLLGCLEQYYDGCMFNLREFCVARDRQGTGLGSAMLTELKARLKPLGVTSILLYTARGEATSGFYQRRGFGECDNMVLMYKDL